MANTTEKIIKTIIIIRNDTEANFQANSSLVLRKGEMAITISEDVTKPSKIKIGDGVHTWGELPYSNNSSSGSGTGVDFTPDGKALELTSDNVLQLIGINTAHAGESFRLTADGTAIEWFITASKDEVNTNKTLIEQINNSLTNNYYTKEQVDAKVGSVFTYKGTVATRSDLDVITNPSIGDSYVVEDENKLYSYSESEGWHENNLGVDLSKCVLISDFTPIKETVESLPDTILAKIEAIVSDTGFELRSNTTIKDTNGRYVADGDHLLARLETVVPNGKAGLMSGLDKSRLDMLVETSATGGQANIVENVTVGGQNVSVDSNKTVNIPIAGEQCGVVRNVKNGEEAPINNVIVNADGIMSIPEVKISSLVEDPETNFIISGGGANE